MRRASATWENWRRRSWFGSDAGLRDFFSVWTNGSSNGSTISVQGTWRHDLEEALAGAEERTMSDALSPGEWLVARPVVQHVWSTFLDRLSRFCDGNVLPRQSPELERGLAKSLFRVLSPLVRPTFVLELNVARLRGLLAGETPEARYESYLERLQQPEIHRALIDEYRVLARLVLERSQAWANSTLELLERLWGDAELIRRVMFGGRDPGPVTEIDCGGGDSHRGGRSVAVLRFASGRRLVYKPRSLALEEVAQGVLGWLSSRDESPVFRRVEVLDREDYGWMEYVARKVCKRSDELRRFYYRQGGLIALSYAVGAIDLHFENLIAVAEQPVIVDLESFLQPSLIDDEKIASAGDLTFLQSVLRTGLLPLRVLRSEINPAGIDISGLGSEDGQISPFSVRQSSGQGTDQMCLVRAPIKIAAQKNRPTAEGDYLLEHRRDLEEGFRGMYDLLARDRAAFLEQLTSSANGDCPVRVILRPTNFYAKILAESYHPDLMRDAVEREKILSACWTGSADRKALRAALPFEIDDLWSGDIPYFSSRIAEAGLLSSTGQPLPGVECRSALSVAEERLSSLGPKDCERQSWILNASIATTIQRRGDENVDGYRLPARPPTRPVGAPLAAACLAADRLRELWFEKGSDGPVNWLDVQATESERTFALNPLSVDLYTGLPGVCLFLAYLAHVTGRSDHDEMARRCVASLEAELEKALTGGFREPSAFDGLAGVAYVLSHVGALWSEPRFVRLARSLLPSIVEGLEDFERFDLLSGWAGISLCLLSLDAVDRCESALGLAKRCGDRLVMAATELDGALVWRDAERPDPPLTGLGHGAAGVALALGELAAVAGTAEHAEIAVYALDYERRLFSKDARNWPDLRRSSRQRKFQVAWCHGAAGIGLARLRSWLRHPDGETEHEVREAVQTTLSEGLSASQCLCHGTLGNLDLLVSAARVFPRWKLGPPARDLLASTIRQINDQGFLTAAPFALDTPGLMLGLSGIGLGLLRCELPDEVPSVLTLEPPRHGWKAT